jgi:hypothetical protein
MRNIFSYKLIAPVTLLLLGVFFVPVVSHAQINAQGLGALLLQCAKVTRANQVEGPSSMGFASDAERSVAIKSQDEAKQLKKEACEDAIAKYTMGELLRKMTQETLNWINNGFKGDPTFVQNPQAYFQSIANEQISSLTSLVQFDAEAYPFGRDAARSIITTELGGYFENRARYTLNNYIPTGNVDDFRADFAIGGWDAFLAQGFQIQNNPGGFAILTAQEKAERTRGQADLNSEIRLAQQKLLQNNGFLNLERCVRSKAGGEYIPPEIVDGVQLEESYYEAQAQVQRALGNEAAAMALLQHVCQDWVTETPGTVISHALNKVTIDIPADQSIFADEINESLNVVFAALLNQMFQNGITSLEENTNNAQQGLNEVFSLGSIGLGDLLFDPAGSLSSGLSQFGEGFNENENFFGGSGSNLQNIETAQGQLQNWSSAGEQFDIFNQLPYIIYLQERFLGDPNGNLAELPTSIDEEGNETVTINQTTGEPFEDPAPGFNGVIENRYLLNQTILALEELDVCIPGPNPTYKQKLARTLANAERKILDEQEVVLGVFGALDPLDLTSAETKVTENAQKAIRRLKEAGDQFMELIDNKYNWQIPGNMPSITPAANDEIIKIDRYLDTIAQNEERARQIRTNLVALRYILQQIEELQQNAPNLPEEALEAQGRALVQAFYQTAPNAVTEEDIQNLQSASLLAAGNISYIDELTSLCEQEKMDSTYTGQTRFQWYRSRITGQILGSNSYAGNPNNVNGNDAGGFLYNPQPILEYGQNEFAVVIEQVAGILGGRLSGYTVIQTLSSSNIIEPDFGPGTQWYESFLGDQYPGDKLQ